MGLYVKALIEPGLCDWPVLIERMTAGPARVIGGPPATLAAGTRADIAVIDPDTPYTVDVSAFVSRSRNCPYDGWSLKGRAAVTIVGGRVRHRCRPA